MGSVDARVRGGLGGGDFMYWEGLDSRLDTVISEKWCI